jgi:hypothetical protein
MFNSPPGLSERMDLAKMLAILDLIEPLENEEFRIWRQTRTGLLSYPLHVDAARAHLATSVYLQMALKPHIVHVVGHTEAHHAATAEDVIESCNIARRAIQNALNGQADMTYDPAVKARRTELVKEAQALIEAIRRLAEKDVPDPWLDAATLGKAVRSGLLDALSSKITLMHAVQL